jgi:hypothetical protein
MSNLVCEASLDHPFFLGGEIHIFFCAADKSGPIYDVDWNPNGLEFAVVYGFMPAKAVLFDRECNKVFWCFFAHLG